MIHAGGVTVRDGITVRVGGFVGVLVTVGVWDGDPVGVAGLCVLVAVVVIGETVDPLLKYTFPVRLIFAFLGLFATLTRVDVS